MWRTLVDLFGKRRSVLDDEEVVAAERQWADAIAKVQSDVETIAPPRASLSDIASRIKESDALMREALESYHD